MDMLTTHVSEPITDDKERYADTLPPGPRIITTLADASALDCPKNTMICDLMQGSLRSWVGHRIDPNLVPL